MVALLYERRYWNIQLGKVLAIFSMEHDDELFMINPPANGYWIWLDDKPQRLRVDVSGSIQGDIK